MKNKLIIDYLHNVNTSNREKVIFIQENPPQHELTTTRLGRYRVEINKHIHKEMKEIDSLVRNRVG